MIDKYEHQLTVWTVDTDFIELATDQLEKYGDMLNDYFIIVERMGKVDTTKRTTLFPQWSIWTKGERIVAMELKALEERALLRMT